MSNLNLNKGKHLSIEDRIFIEYALDGKCTLKGIAGRLGKDPTTISKEIKRNRIVSSRKNRSELLSCQNYKECDKKHICTQACDRLCKKCKMINCYRACPDYSSKKCMKLSRFPYVCNGCIRTIACNTERYIYRAKVAHANYQELLKSSREGLNITPGELSNLDNIISPLIMKGQSISHIYANHQLEINCSERTIYKYFDKNVFTARNIDLPRKVKYKLRKNTGTLSQKTPNYRIGRTYDDFNIFLEANPNIPVVEMDTV